MRLGRLLEGGLGRGLGNEQRPASIRGRRSLGLDGNLLSECWPGDGRSDATPLAPCRPGASWGLPASAYGGVCG